MASEIAITSVPAWMLGAIALAFIIIAFFLIGMLRKLFYNTLLGLAALLIINWLGKGYGISIGINLLTVLISAVLGLAGVGLLILLHLAGIRL